MAARVDLYGILENLKTIFETANTTTGSPIDLSQDMSSRVNQVMTLNPMKIPVEANNFPMVTCFVTGKTMESATIGRQSSAKRKAIVEIDIVAAVYNDDFHTFKNDPADQDINYLMENIELILRSNESLTNKVLWQLGDRVDYYDIRLSEETHLRSGILSLKATVYY